MFRLYQRHIGNSFQKSSTITVLTWVSLVLLTTSYGCTQKPQSEVSLEIKNIQSVGSNGEYKVIGSTSLPKSSRIAIAAVRYLRPNNKQENIGSNVDLNINRSILDRRIVQVNDKGEWEADLNLWQVAPDGSYQEVWQVNQSQTALIPQNDVTFTATFDLESQANMAEITIDKPNEQQSQATQLKIPELEGKSLRFSELGEKYVQASLSQSISLPAAKTVPPIPQAEDINGGWGDRYLIKPETVASGFAPSPPTKSRQTTAPLSASEFLR
ncbi:hypothetical protein [Calothrix sp. UHCC 0171]|uniref:hypothetical protein n=1 Tax=Calothrix sp. UHCC 0171 TaxID=3110245 RepID=UPI002B1FC184|nr:hypothetical protein [Calothrix sp. UHCC 0171]MEA5570127.1 hypothetical protein [Calothrix sp. UHCC 0171]